MTVASRDALAKQQRALDRAHPVFGERSGVELSLARAARIVEQRLEIRLPLDEASVGGVAEDGIRLGDFLDGGAGEARFVDIGIGKESRT